MPNKRFVGSREWSKLPKVNKRSLRFGFNWEWDRPRRYMFLGIPESGKSVLNEDLALRHRHIWDLYGSKDNEGLCWCRKMSPIDDILLIHGDNTDLTSSWDHKSVSKVTMHDLEQYEAVLTCNSFYSSEPVKFDGIELLVNQLFSRAEWDPGIKNGGHGEHADLIYLLMREMMNVIYAKINTGMNEKDAKASLLYFIREMRHFGVSVGGDTLRWTGIDKEFRDLADYTFFKRLGEKGLPREKWFIYNYVKPKAFALMPKNKFVCLRVDGAIAWGENENAAYGGDPPFHKPEGLDIIKELDIRITHGAEVVKSTAGLVGETEHARIMELYQTEGTSRKVGAKIGRSNSTVADQVRVHNSEVEIYGACRRCKRLESNLATVKITPRD